MRLVSSSRVTGTLLIARCCSGPVVSSHPSSDFSTPFIPGPHPDPTEKNITETHKPLGHNSLSLHVSSSAFPLLSLAAAGSYFHISLDSLQGTGSEPDGHRMSTLEPPSRQHLSKFPSNSACVCVHNMPRTELCFLWWTWGCHPSPHVQIHPIHVHVGRCWVCKSLCRCNRAAK